MNSDTGNVLKVLRKRAASMWRSFTVVTVKSERGHALEILINENNEVIPFPFCLVEQHEQ